MKDEEAREIIGQQEWEKLSRMVPPAYLRSEDRERYIELYLDTMEGRMRVLMLKLETAFGPVLSAFARLLGESDPMCRVCGEPTPWSDRRGPVHPECRKEENR